MFFVGDIVKNTSYGKGIIKEIDYDKKTAMVKFDESAVEITMSYLYLELIETCNYQEVKAGSMVEYDNIIGKIISFDNNIMKISIENGNIKEALLKLIHSLDDKDIDEINKIIREDKDAFNQTGKLYLIKDDNKKNKTKGIAKNQLKNPPSIRAEETPRKRTREENFKKQYDIYSYDFKIKECINCNNKLSTKKLLLRTKDNKERQAVFKHCYKCNQLYLHINNCHSHKIEEVLPTFKIIKNITNSEQDNLNKKSIDALKTECEDANTYEKIECHIYDFHTISHRLKCKSCKKELVDKPIKLASGIIWVFKYCESCGKHFLPKNLYELSKFNHKIHDRIIFLTDSNEYIENPLPKIYISSNKIHCCNDDFSEVDIVFQRKGKSNITKKIKLKKCNKCGKIWIKSDKLIELTDSGYIPFGKIVSTKSFLTLKDKSLLNLYGYKVQKGKITKEQRRWILDFVINNKIMTFAEVRGLLKHLIKFHQKQEIMFEAVSKWEADLEYIQIYHHSH